MLASVTISYFLLDSVSYAGPVNGLKKSSLTFYSLLYERDAYGTNVIHNYDLI